MANCKLILACVAVFVASCTGVSVSTRINGMHSIDQCDTSTATIRLLQTNIYEPAKWIIPVKRILNYPETGLNSHRISCLKVTDLDTSNHGGYPKIIFGGVGSYDVQISFVSQWGQPLNFTVEIWADE